MGNCLYPLEKWEAGLPSNSSQTGSLQVDAADLNTLNYSYTEGDEDFYDDLDLNLVAPCRSCHLLGPSSLPFFGLVSALGLLAAAVVLYGLLGGPARRWHLPRARALLVQQAGACALCAAVLPALAPGLGWPLPLCRPAVGAWYAGAFAQALLVAGGSWLRPEPGRTQLVALSAAAWTVSVLLALPAAGSARSSPGLCAAQPSSQQPGWGWALAAVCAAAFLLLPLGLGAGWAVRRARGQGHLPRADPLWAWFALWAPHGVAVPVDGLVRLGAVLPSCRAQQALDVAVDLALGLTALHCLAAPLLLLLLLLLLLRRGQRQTPDGAPTGVQPGEGDAMGSEVNDSLGPVGSLPSSLPYWALADALFGKIGEEEGEGGPVQRRLC
ncbi:atypical chemokine receptor 1 [Tachyglossus aculeatus]|uniref:atypical chemokine receptor 1 n=1 Tax=Tachyglossus aculeatus TaxID=9261 RepID=UPI0018F7C443|nr:atypical chemokine receptor 1 [Tachyglossus aculeatus]